MHKVIHRKKVWFISQAQIKPTSTTIKTTEQPKGKTRIKINQPAVFRRKLVRKIHTKSNDIEHKIQQGNIQNNENKQATRKVKTAQAFA